MNEVIKNYDEKDVVQIFSNKKRSKEETVILFNKFKDKNPGFIFDKISNRILEAAIKSKNYENLLSLKLVDLNFTNVTYQHDFFFEISSKNDEWKKEFSFLIENNILPGMMSKKEKKNKDYRDNDILNTLLFDNKKEQVKHLFSLGYPKEFINKNNTYFHFLVEDHNPEGIKELIKMGFDPQKFEDYNHPINNILYFPSGSSKKKDENINNIINTFIKHKALSKKLLSYFCFDVMFSHQFNNKRVANFVNKYKPDFSFYQDYIKFSKPYDIKHHSDVLMSEQCQLFELSLKRKMNPSILLHEGNTATLLNSAINHHVPEKYFNIIYDCYHKEEDMNVELWLNTAFREKNFKAIDFLTSKGHKINKNNLQNFINELNIKELSETGSLFKHKKYFEGFEGETFKIGDYSTSLIQMSFTHENSYFQENKDKVSNFEDVLEKTFSNIYIMSEKLPQQFYHCFLEIPIPNTKKEEIVKKHLTNYTKNVSTIYSYKKPLENIQKLHNIITSVIEKEAIQKSIENVDFTPQRNQKRI